MVGFLSGADGCLMGTDTVESTRARLLSVCSVSRGWESGRVGEWEGELFENKTTRKPFSAVKLPKFFLYQLSNPEASDSASCHIVVLASGLVLLWGRGLLPPPWAQKQGLYTCVGPAPRALVSAGLFAVLIAPALVWASLLSPVPRLQSCPHHPAPASHFQVPFLRPPTPASKALPMPSRGCKCLPHFPIFSSRAKVLRPTAGFKHARRIREPLSAPSFPGPSRPAACGALGVSLCPTRTRPRVSLQNRTTCSVYSPPGALVGSSICLPALCPVPWVGTLSCLQQPGPSALMSSKTN